MCFRVVSKHASIYSPFANFFSIVTPDICNRIDLALDIEDGRTCRSVAAFQVPEYPFERARRATTYHQVPIGLPSALNRSFITNLSVPHTSLASDFRRMTFMRRPYPAVLRWKRVVNGSNAAHSVIHRWTAVVVRYPRSLFVKDGRQHRGSCQCRGNYWHNRGLISMHLLCFHTPYRGTLSIAIQTMIFRPIPTDT